MNYLHHHKSYFSDKELVIDNINIVVEKNIFFQHIITLEVQLLGGYSMLVIV